MKPTGVQIHRGDGSVLDAELIHEGVDDNGMDHWAIAGAEFHPERGDHITVEVLPPRTSIGFKTPDWIKDE